MSMTVSASNYMGSIYQSTQTGSSEKPGRKDALPDAGKTRQSAVSASLDQVNLGEEGIAVTEVSRQQGARQSNAKKQPAVPRMDTVEISAEGQTAAAQLREQQDGADAGVEDLSKYTDTELKLMYYAGKITRREYEDETGETLE